MTLVRSAVGVHVELVGDDLFRDPRLDVVSEAIGKGDEHVVQTLLVVQFGEKFASISAFVLQKALAYSLERDVAVEIEDEVVEQVLGQFLHARSP